jgi:uncharacterized small protein (DUF1192 family)
MSFDDLEPQKQTPKPIDLSKFSIFELKERIAAMEAEIERCKQMIASKEKTKSSADSVFKK